MCDKRNIARALICIVCVNNFVDIFFCIINACKLVGIKVDEIHGIVKLPV